MCNIKTIHYTHMRTHTHTYVCPENNNLSKIMLISTHAGFLSLAFTQSRSLSVKHIHTDVHTGRTQAYVSSHNSWRQKSLILYQPFFLYVSRAMLPPLSQRCLQNLPVSLEHIEQITATARDCIPSIL